MFSLQLSYRIDLSVLYPALSAIRLENGDVKTVEVTFIPNSSQIGFRLKRICSPIRRPRYFSPTANPVDVMNLSTPYC